MRHGNFIHPSQSVSALAAVAGAARLAVHPEPPASPGSLQRVLAFLGAHHQWAYLVLFLGAYFETVVPFSLFVPGEIFFLGGALLAGMGTLELGGVMAALYSGGILGDNCSYWMGRHFGVELFERLARWPVVGRLVHRENYQKGVEFFRRRGAVAVFTARLSGPLSWVTPAMAGIFRLNYLTFLRFNTPGVILGISGVVFAGYFFGNHLQALRSGFAAHAPALLLAAAALIALFLAVRRHASARGKLKRDRP